LASHEQAQNRILADKVDKPDIGKFSHARAVKLADAFKAPMHFVTVILGR
jgi:hypothetical protein